MSGAGAWLLCQFVAGVDGATVGFGMWLAAAQCLSAPVLRALLPATITAAAGQSDQSLIH